MPRGEAPELDPRELLGPMYEKVFPPLTDDEAREMLRPFARDARRGAVPYRKANDTEGAEAQEARAERIEALGGRERITREEYDEIIPLVERAIGLASDRAHATSITDKRAFKELMDRWNALRRLKDYLGAKREREAAE